MVHRKNYVFMHEGNSIYLWMLDIESCVKLKKERDE
jgi:hypothetical protein